MNRLDYTALIEGLNVKLGRKPTSSEVIDAVVKSGFVGSGFRRVVEGKRVFLEQDDAPQAQQGAGSGEQGASSGDRNDGAVNLPETGA